MADKDTADRAGGMVMDLGARRMARMDAADAKAVKLAAEAMLGLAQALEAERPRQRSASVGCAALDEVRRIAVRGPSPQGVEPLELRRLLIVAVADAVAGSA